MHALSKGSMLAVALAAGASAAGSTDADGAAIRSVARDYIEAFYSADVSRLEHVLHPEVIGRHVTIDPRTHRSAIDTASARSLIQRTRERRGKSLPDSLQRAQLTVLDRVPEAAMVKVVAADSIDYLQMAKLDGEWKIVDVLWTSPGTETSTAAAPLQPLASPPLASPLPGPPVPPRMLPAPPAPPAAPAKPPADCSSRVFMLI